MVAKTKPKLKVVEVSFGQYRNVPRALRNIAKEIESGEHGLVGSCAVVFTGKNLEIYGIGPDSAAPTTICMLQAAATRLLTPLVRLGDN